MLRITNFYFENKRRCIEIMSILKLWDIIVNWKLLSYSALKIKIKILIDNYSLVFSLVLRIIVLGIMEFAFLYVPQSRNLYFYVFFYGFSFSMFLLIFIPSIFTLLLAWDGLAIFRFFLIVYYGKFSSFSSGIYVYFLQRLGDAFFVVAIGFLFLVGGHFENSCDNMLTTVVRVFFFLALITKRAKYPFNSWLPLAMAAPTPVSALVHSSTLVTAGVYLLIRYNYIVIEISNLILICALITGLGGRFWACFETDIKKIIAFSTTANLGFMMFALSLGKIKGAFVHLILHACFKALLFVSVGHFLYVSHIQDVRSIGSLFHIRKSLRWIVIFCVASIVRLPFFSGFFSKHYVLGLRFKTFKKLRILGFMVFYIYLRGFYGWRLISFIVGQNSFYFSADFKFNIFSRKKKLILLGIFRFLFLGKRLYVGGEDFDFYSVFFYFFRVLGAYVGFFHFSFFEMFPIFIQNFYIFLNRVRRVSPVR